MSRSQPVPTTPTAAEPLIVHVEDVQPRQRLRAAQGWVDVDIRFMTEALGLEGMSFTLFRTVLAPGATHMPHIHQRADEFVYIVAGTALLGDGSTCTTGGPGTLHYAPAGRVHWTGNRSDADGAVELVGGYIGAGSLEDAGYQPIDEMMSVVRRLIDGVTQR